MATETLREKLHVLIDTSSEDKLEEIYDTFQNEEYTDDFKAILDEEFKEYEKNGNVLSNEDVNQLIEQLLHAKIANAL